MQLDTPWQTVMAFDFSTDGRKHPVLYFQGSCPREWCASARPTCFHGVRLKTRMFGMTDKPEKLLDLTRT